ncbi:SNF2-related protein [Acidovorax sp. sic0104]|uniref:helicase-related protein n=1 Tax=Acidovorax sp. sic0104 TaxID=2854784 RepID=UPI001C46CCEB|nr:SNF2-related protein [Acidovorax sp. sic0104]MBV7542169.1 DEAD/DEAH box helicase family protein [Acidovorax sp. sic0104]
MKINPIAAACLWLPGFDPDEDPNQVPGLLSAPIAPVASCVVETIAAAAPSAPVKPKWPRLFADVHAQLGGTVVKFDANIEAITLLRELEKEERDPTAREREVLNRYTGWGGLPQAFNLKQSDTAWLDRSAKLKEFLSAEEHASAMASTTDSHYTPVEVVEAMWAMAQRVGFTGGRVLDPCTGTGFFLGAMPQEVAERSTVTAVEVDNVSSRISKKLYRQYGARVLNKGFEQANLPADSFDCVISNVPFGQTKAAEVRNVPFARFNLHNYFIARSLELVRPGGLVVILTSSFTMDSMRDGARAYLAGQAELVGAIRLPDSTFKKMANTSVTTDVLIFKRRVGTTEHDKSWINVTALPKGSPINGNAWYSSNAVTVNSWFARNPGMVVGKLTHESSAYGARTICAFEGDLKQALQERIANLPEGIYAPRPQSQRKPRSEAFRIGEGVRPGLTLIEGKVCEVDDGLARPVQASEKVLARMAGMIGIRDAVRRLIAAQAVNADEAMLSVYRTALSIAYDLYVAQWGYLGDKLNRAAFKADPDLPLLMSLECRVEGSKSVDKAAIFYHRTVGAAKKVSRCESTQDALQVSLSEFGRVVPERIGGLVGMGQEEVMADLEQKGCVFLDPATMNWAVEDEYLSGDVREKLILAEDAGERFERNVAALLAVQPKKLTPAEITPRIGSTWIPAPVYAQFLDEILEVGEGPFSRHTVEVNLAVGTWSVDSPYSCETSVAATQTHGTRRVPCGRLMELALNQQEPSVYDSKSGGSRVANTTETIAAREKLYELRAKFKEWVWSDEARAEMLAEAYNTQFNSYVVRRYNGEHLVLPGMSQAFTLRAHQKDAVWRLLSTNHNVLLAHAVGAGKTLEMICGAMELRRVGRATKPMLTIPTHLIEQVSREFMEAYPGANILVASKDDLHGDKRRTMLSRIATGNWDCVIITHCSFERIPMGAQYMREHIAEEVEKIEDAIRERHGEPKSNKIVKQLGRAKKSWEARLKRLSSESKKDNVLTFEELGVDYILCDEAHSFKSLYKFTKMDRIAGLPNQDSQRAFDMFVKCRHINRLRGDGTGVVLATATPISNALGEAYTMQRFLQEAALEAKGVANFDAWAGNFGESVTSLELAPDGGGYRVSTRFAKYTNVVEMMKMFRQVADIKTSAMLDLPVPRCRRETVIADGGPALKAYVETLVKRAERLRAGGVKPKDDNMLLVTGDGRKAALDLRMVDPFAEETEVNKISLCAKGVFKKWTESASFKGTQLVFSDFGTPKNDGRFDAYNALRDKLVELGIPRHEVAFIHEFVTDAAKAALFRDVRAGVIRVVLGSTSMLGTGTNVQERLCAIWHMDVPWRPSDIEQREGRILRQGNQCEEVSIYYVVTRGSFDVYMMNLVESKQRFIEQLMRGDETLRTLDEASEALTYAEIKALASGNPAVIERCGVESELAKLTMLHDKWQRDRQANLWNLKHLPSRIASEEQKIARMSADTLTVAGAPAGTYAFKVGGFGDVPASDAAKAFKQFVQSLPRSSGPVVIATYRGLDLLVERDATSQLEGWLKGSMEYTLTMEKSWGSVLNSVDTLLDGLASQTKQLQRGVERLRAQSKDLGREVETPFPKLERLEFLQRRKIELDTMLDLNVGDLSAVDESALAEEAVGA